MGKNAVDPLPSPGCEAQDIKIAPISSADNSAKYECLVMRDNGGTIAMLLTFSQPISNLTVIFPGDIKVQDVSNPVDILIEIPLPVSSPMMQFEMEILWEANAQEPCLLSGICKVTDNPSEVQQIYHDFLSDPLQFREVTRYNSILYYTCPLAKEFQVNSLQTEPFLEKSCDWNQNWVPNNDMPPCVCKFSSFFNGYFF